MFLVSKNRELIESSKLQEPAKTGFKTNVKFICRLSTPQLITDKTVTPEKRAASAAKSLMKTEKLEASQSQYALLKIRLKQSKFT